MSPANSLPAWVPSQGLSGSGPGRTPEWDPDERILRVEIASGADHVEFGDIPSNCRVQLASAGSRSVTRIDAVHVGRGSRLILTRAGAHQVTVGPTFHTVEVASSQSQRATCLHPELAGSKLILRRGDHSLTAGVDVRVEVDGDKQSVGVTGPGAVRSLSGTGRITLQGCLKDGAEISDVDGTLTVKGEVRNVTLDAPDAVLVFADHIKATTITASKVTAGAMSDCEVTVDRQFVGQQSVSESHIHVTGDGDPSLEPAVCLADPRSPPGQETALRLSIDDDPALPPWPWGKDQKIEVTITGGSITCPAARHVIAGAMKGTDVSGGHVWIRNNLELDGAAVDAQSLFVGGATSGGNGDEIDVSGDVALVRNVTGGLSISSDATVVTGGKVDDAEIEAAGLRTRGEVNCSVATVTEAAAFDGDLIDSRVTAHGNVAISGNAVGTEVDYHGSDDGVLTVAAELDALTVHGVDSLATIEATSLSALKRATVRVRGTAVLTMPDPGGGRDATSPTLQHLELLDVDSVFCCDSSAGMDVSSLVAPPGAVVALKGGRPGVSPTRSSSRARDPMPFALPLGHASGIRLYIPKGLVHITGGDTSARPSMEVAGSAGSEIKVEAQLAGMVIHPRRPTSWQTPDSNTWASGDDGQPWLATDISAVIYDIEGPIRLRNHRGSITGTATPGSGRRWREHHLRRPTDVHTGAWLIDVSPLNDDETAGHLRRIDPTRLDLHQLEHLRTLDTFDPEGPALITDALTGPRGGDVNEFDRQAHAERARKIADIVSARAVSGSSRTAALWSAARIHHRQVRDTSTPEAVGRWLHRLVGYGQRPIPPLALYTGMVLIWSLVLLNANHPESCPPPAGEAAKLPYFDPLSRIDQILRVLLAPAAFFRLPGDVTGPPVLCEAGWEILLVATVLIPLVYFLIAVRNTLANPVEGG